MPANRNALIRYKTIDNCLRNRQKRWTLDMLIDKVSDALYEYEGIDKGISRRTLQADIQMMRSDKLGYNAPIVIIERKYYTYENPEYSITNIPLSSQDLERMNEAVEVLKQFKGFSHFSSLNDVVQKLEDHVYTAAHDTQSVIEFEKNDRLKGLEYLDVIYNAIINKKSIEITYQSFRARNPSTFIFSVWWLKEFKNRWFAVGIRKEGQPIINLALDRVINLKTAESGTYVTNDITTPNEFYKDVIGVTVSRNERPSKVILEVTRQHAPYIETKPLHHSQEVLKQTKDGIIIQIVVQLNYELEKEILGFGEGMRVLAPKRLRGRIYGRYKQGLDFYNQQGVMGTKEI